jgi:hypothetical protein
MRTEPQQFYTNTFVQVAPDSTAVTGIVPPMRGESKTVPLIEYELLASQPYKLTQHELIFETYIVRQGITANEAKRRRTAIWNELFQKSYPCLRASMLTKKYGWGAHYDAEGRIALHAIDSREYARLIKPGSGTALVFAMRSKRA